MENSTRIGKAIFHMVWSILCYIAAYGILYAALGTFHADACFIQMLSSCTVIYLSWRKEKKQGKDYLGQCGFRNLSFTGKDLGILALLGFSLNCAVGGVLNLIPISPELAEEYLEMSSAPVEGVKPLLAFFIISFAVPVVEETFFRGTLLRRLCRDMNPLSALGLLSLVFGALHGQILWVVYASILGLFLGLTWLIYKSIYPSILVHMCFNLVSGIPMLMNPESLLYRVTYGSVLFRLIMAVAGIAGVCWVLLRVFFPKFMETERAEQQILQSVGEHEREALENE